MAVRLQMKLGVIAEQDRASDSPDTVVIVEPTIGAIARSKGHLYLIVTSTIYTSFPPESERLKPVPPGPGRPETQRLEQSVNATVHQLNGLLYGPQDYALVLVKPAEAPGLPGPGRGIH